MIKIRKIILYICGIFVLSSCAHNSMPNDIVVAESASVDGIDHFRINESEVSEPEAVLSNDQIKELEIIPTEINENVDKWINYFQNKGRANMERYLRRSTRYEALMKKVLRDSKLPEDLFYVALIESGFSSQAFSHASAVGYWQFIRGTGKRYKLKINQLVDERRDPVLSTRAAAEYFKDLYERFNSWYLAMAAYNVGEGRIDKVIKKYKTRDFWTLSRIKRALPSETDNYVPKYIAAKLIAKEPDKYGFDGIDFMPPIEFDHIEVDQPINLRLMADKMNYNYEDFKALNPKFKGEVAPLELDNKLGLRIPPGSYEVAIAASKESVADNVTFVADQKEVRPYKIKNGDTLSTIARKFRTNIAYLRDINDFGRKKVLKVGRSIFVPDRTPLKEKRPDLTTKKFHIVKKGENVASIAKRYQTSVSTLRKLNGLKSKSNLRVGVRILLPENKKL